MNTRKIAAEYRLAHWAGIMKERRESGLSVKAYCENVGIHENTYFYWQRKLRESACESASDTTAMTPPGFTEIKMSEQPVPPPASAGPQAQVSIEISGVRITAGIEYPVAKLVALLREAVRSC